MPESGRTQELNAKATSFYHSGEYRQAIQVWQEVLQADPENQRAKEGIQMAALLLEEAQITGHATDAPAEANSESPEGIARVREGIQKVREFLGASQHLRAMEVCQSLLKLAPRSEAVREILEEAREAYEAQPFIAEHLEIARQLFVQDRLNEASVELQKIFFLNSGHAEARKLEAKILSRREKEVSLPSSPEPPPPSIGSDTQRIPPISDPAGTPPASSGGSPEGERGISQDWEADLANLSLGPGEPEPPSSAAPSAAEVEEEPIPLADLSEPIAPVTAKGPEARPPAPVAPSPDSASSLPDFDLSQIQEDLLPPRVDSGPAAPSRLEKPKAVREKRPAKERREVVLPARTPRRGSPVAGLFLAAVMVLVAGGAAWWYLGDHGASASGNGNQSDSPNRNVIPRRAPTGPPAEGGTTNLGLSSSGSRGSNAAKAGVGLPVPPVADTIPAEKPSAEDARREITDLASEARSRMLKGDYAEAVKYYSKILDLDPANVEIKEQMDQAAAKVLEQKRLEEDLQSAKEFFMDKDYESALRKFYRLPRDRNLGTLDLFMRNAWYNWAVLSMKGGNCPQALQRLDEVLTLDPRDQEAIKQKEVAEHYRDRPKDSVFFAYTDRLTYRTLNQK